MCKVLDMTSRLVNEKNIRWDIDIEPGRKQEICRIRKDKHSETIFINIMTDSFDRIPELRDATLKDLKEQKLHNQLKCIGE